MRRAVLIEWSAWTAAVAAMAIVLPLLSYATRDPDSRLYAEIAAGLSAEPVSRWIAPEWPAGWYGEGLFVEHPVGVFLAPAALGALGYPARQAPYLVNAVAQVGSLLLMAALARRFASGGEARALLFLLQLLPIAFTYRIRANQEQILLVLLLAALYATERARNSYGWAPAVAMAAIGCVLVKGLVGLVVLAVSALWLLARGREGLTRGARRGWLALLGAAAAVVLATAAYEAVYRQVTGASFLAVYLDRQMGPALARQSAGLLAQKSHNLVWYAGRLLWFPFPWSVAFLGAGWVIARTLIRNGLERPRAWRGFAFALGVAVLYIGPFSLSDRRADRYIFPAYFAVGAAGAVAALRGSRTARRFADWLEALPAWSPAAPWLALDLIHVGAGRLLHLPTVKIWGPSS